MSSSTLLTAHLLSIPTAFFFAGYNGAFSHNALIHMYSLPASVSTPIFAKVYYTGTSLIAPGQVLAASAFGYLAYIHHNSKSADAEFKRNLYGAAAILVLGTGIFTGTMMQKGIQRLIAISKDGALQAKAGVNEEAVGLMKTWVAQNWIRFGLNFGAGMAGLYAALS